MPSRELVITANRHETKAAILEDDQLVEIFFQRANEYSLAGSIHKGRVTRVLPGMQSAFVDIGLERDTFLYVSDFFEENDEEYEKLSGPGEETRAAATPVSAPPAARPAAEPEEGIVTPVSEGAAEQPLETESTAAELPAHADAEHGGGDRRSRRVRRRKSRGRGFPEEKYAEHPVRSSEGQREPEAAELEDQEEDLPLILPGESLAKYRDRISSQRTPTEVEPEATASSEADAGVAPEAQPLDLELEYNGETRSWDVEEAPSATVSGSEPNAATAGLDRRLPVEPETAELEAVELPAPARAQRGRSDRAPRARRSRGGRKNALSLANVPPKGAEDETIVEEESTPSPVAGSELEGAPAAGASAPGAEPSAVAQKAAVEPQPESIVPESEDFQDEDELRGFRQPVEEEDEGPAGSGGLRAQVRDSGTDKAYARLARRRRRRPRPEEHSSSPMEPAVESSVDTQPVAERERGNGKPDIRPARITPSITDLLKEGQEILVQIAKEPLGQKGARITSHIALPGRYVVYMPTVDHLGVSRKIGSDEERQRLRRILQKHRQGIPGGFIMRTAGEGRKEEEIQADMQYLFNLWLDIRQRAEKRRAPALIYHDVEIVQRILRDYLTDSFKSIWVDNEEVYADVLSYIQRFQPELVNRVKLYTRKTPIFDAFGITAEIEKALRPKVWLKSGGYIVINQTEALVAIDVNTGKFVGKSNRLEDTIVKTNLEAVKEIVRQIRLRDLGGIIVVDFIDMEERKNRQKVMQALEEAMRSDRAPSKILQFNDFGLVAITRKRVKQSLERTLCTPCPYCEGAGYIKSVSTVIGEILVEAKKLAGAIDDKQAVLRVHPEVAKELKSTKNTYLEELEETLGVPVVVTSDPLLHQEKFDLS